MIIKKWWFILKYFLFWMGMFAFYRLLFMIIYFKRFSDDSIWTVLKSFYKALYLDASTACYLLAIPSILLALAYIFQNYKFLKAINVYTVLMIFIYTFIAIGEDGLYREWGSKLDFQALSHFVHFGEVIRTISTYLLVSFFLASAVFGALFTWLYWKKVRLTELFSTLKYPFVRVMLGLLIFAVNGLVIFTGIRGGWSPIPIQQSVAYYSRNPVLNDMSVNSGWNLISNIHENYFSMNKNPFVVMPFDEARKIVEEMYETPKDSTPEILTTTRPNICFIILESWSSNVIGSCGGIQGITPFFDSLTTKGILFDEMIKSASASDQGISAVLSGYPNTYKLFFTHQPAKSKKVPGLSKEFHNNGYATAFYYGGQLSYGNIRSYLFNQQFDIVKEGSEYDGSFHRGRLGIPDSIMLQQYALSMNTEKEPFMNCLFTLSSHMPYDIPSTPKFDHLKEEGKYASSVHYSDESLGHFFETVRKMPWYKNTLFVLVADHAHASPTMQLLQSLEFNRIPCLFFGEVIKPKYRGKHISRRVMQADIAATILEQCNMSTAAFHWSRNMFNPSTQQWAYYPLVQGGGIADEKTWVAFDSRRNSYFLSNSTDSVEIKKLRKKGEALQQVLFDEFLKF